MSVSCLLRFQRNLFISHIFIEHLDVLICAVHVVQLPVRKWNDLCRNNILEATLSAINGNLWILFCVKLSHFMLSSMPNCVWWQYLSHSVRLQCHMESMDCSQWARGWTGKELLFYFWEGQSVQTHPATYSACTWAFAVEVKHWGCEADYVLLSGADIKNDWSCDLHSCIYGVHRDSLHLNLWGLWNSHSHCLKNFGLCMS